MNVKNFLLITIGLFVSLLSSCSDDPDPEIPNEEELITTLTYTLTPETGGSPVVFSFKDLDGDGGNSPIITGATLAANTSYAGSVELKNELATPASDITEEVEEESDEHQLFFQSTLADLSISYNDTDKGGLPIGLATKVTTGAAGSGTLIITLRHEPNKSADGVKEGNIANAGGETDIQVTFDIDVQ